MEVYVLKDYYDCDSEVTLFSTYEKAKAQFDEYIKNTKEEHEENFKELDHSKDWYSYEVSGNAGEFEIIKQKVV